MIKSYTITGLVCLCYFIQPMRAQSSLFLSPASALSGAPGSLALSLSAPAGSAPAALEWTLAYPSGVTGFAVAPGPALVAAGKTLSCVGGASAYTCLASGLNSNAIGNGSVASVSFNAPAAPSISVSIPNAVGVSATGSSIAISSTGAIFTEIGVSALQCVAAANGDTCTVTLSGTAPTGGALVGISSGNPALSVPASVIISSGATSVSFAAVAAPVTTAQNAPITAALGSSTVTTTVLLSPPSALRAQTSLSLSSGNALSGAPGSLTLSLSSPEGSAPAALEWTLPYPSGITGFTVSAGPALVAAGKSINCAGNASAYTCLASGSNSTAIGNGTVATISFNTPAAPSISVTITNTMAASTTGSSLAISGTGAIFTDIGVSALQCIAAANVAAANSDTCTVTLSGAAPAGGALISLSSTDPALSVPASVTIPSGATSVSFAAVAAPVTTAQNAPITAALGSSTVTTTVLLSPPSALFELQGKAMEVSSIRNGSSVTPEVSPAGLAGTVVVNGNGSVNFVSGQTGNGVYFLNCCSNTNQAYYKFTGAAVGSIFKTKQGQISFTLQSRYSFAQRTVNAASQRYAFDVRDGNGSHLFAFLTQITSGRLVFNYLAGGSGNYYFVPAGMEDSLFGNGVVLQVDISWNKAGVNLYLNNTLVNSVPYTMLSPNWTAASNFDLGAYEYLTFGGYDASDDAIGSFMVNAPVPSGTTPVTVSMASPATGATVSGVSAISANASSTVGIAKVQFSLDGANLGGAVTGAGPSYSYSWNTAAAPNGLHTLSAVATDNSGNTALSSSLSVMVNNPVGPLVSAVSAMGITPSGASMDWSTNTPSDSQVYYGVTSAYGSESSLSTSLVSAHSVNLTGLASSTTYHYQVLSRDSQGNLTSSGDFQFTTAEANSSQPLLQLHTDATEVSALTNGAIVTPSIGPPGFTGLIASNGSGTVNFAPGQTGNGVYFQNCCSNYNNAYYKFTGAALGNIFNTAQGQVTFYLKSRYSFTQRTASAATQRYAFDVRDGNGSHLFGFLTQIASGRLVFNYLAGGSGNYYFVPAGMEDSLFGNGVVLQVDISWSKAGVNLYLNNTLVNSVPYTTLSPNWTAASNFDLGAYEYFTFGGYNASDDLIDEFIVTAVPHQ